jgi:transcriptional regulator with XRE-family HTH domain
MVDQKQVFLMEWRLARGLTQTDLAKRSGTVKSEISRLERGARRMTIEWMTKLADALGITVEDLMTEPPALGLPGALTSKEAANAAKEQVWSTAVLGDVQFGVQGKHHKLITFSGEDWPGIFAPGDLLVVDTRRTSTAAPGLFAILAGEETIIRRVSPTDGAPVLLSGNAAYPALSLTADLKVEGRIVGHLRRL